MKSQMLFGRAALATAASMTCLLVAGAASAVPYYYRGDAFTTQFGLTGVNRVTAVVDVESDQGVYYYNGGGSITGFSGFTIVDGSTPFGQPLQIDIFDMTFDSTGKVTDWNIDLYADIGNIVIYQITSSLGGGDYAFRTLATIPGPGCMDTCKFVTTDGSVSGGGVWSTTPFSTAVPEPATWAMMLVGVGGLGVMARRRRGSGVASA